ncbi:class I SAM-dependent methyltransferase [Kribbella hippodromi]|uniref:class I SAM-dependent methyltransferase n=1 Tax=Kribbella hippodromi TaxID=434347 RepID=UPI0031D81596
MTRSNLIGGEMLNWSDLHPADARPAAAGAAAAALLAAVLQPTDSVLIAGPHAADLILATAAQVTSTDLLVRSAPDAEELAEQLQETKGEVFCGSLDRFPEGSAHDGYDVVVALDGLGRLVGPDTATLPWSEALRRLTARLRPGGRLLLGAENAFGFQRLIQPNITAALPRDEDWGRDVGDQPPAGLKPLLEAIAGSTNTTGSTEDSSGTRGGAGSVQVFGVFPSLVQADLAVAAVDGFAGVVAARAVASCNQGPVLMDPYRLVLDATAAGLGIELAPAWYFVLGTEAPAALPEGVIPSGEGVLLEEQLLAALRVDDQAALRRAIPAYVAWLAGGGAGSPDNVIADGTSYRLFGEPQNLDVVEHLARFAQRALESGARQPWPAAADPHALTARLAAMAGLTVPEPDFTPDEVVRPRGSAEQLATVARLADELAHASARAILFEGTVSGIRRSRPYRIGHAVMNPARVIRRRLKRVLRKVRR